MKHLSLKTFLKSLFFIVALIFFSIPAQGQSFSNSLIQNNTTAPNLIAAQQDFLPPDQVFKPQIFKNSDDEISLIWEVNSDYYLYKDKIFIQPLNQGIKIKEIIWPEAIMHEDEFFGRQPIYDQSAEMIIKFEQPFSNLHTLYLNIEAQGCAKAGLCFAPYNWEQSIVVNPNFSGQDILITEEIQTDSQLLNEHDRLGAFLKEQQYLALPLFFLLGILLTFTPCVLPMLPILSSILTGEKNLTKSRGFFISLSYVLAMGIVYTILGMIAAMLGSGLSAAFQNKYVLIGFALLFILLSASMFGAYQLQTPRFIQNYLNKFASQSKNGTYAGAAIMGALSALIVGPCVTAPLIGIITLISQTQDYVLGGFALFSMSMGMGVPLLILGVSSGYLLPKVGSWMNAITEFFGFIMLGIAVYFLGRILPYFWENILYAVLSLSLTVWFIIKVFKTKQLPNFFILPALLTLGITIFYSYESIQIKERPQFINIVGLNGLNNALQDNQNKISMLEFNAEWCVSCKELEKYTFSDPEVKERLAKLNFFLVDVTENNKTNQQIQKHFGIYGPPAILFFDQNGNEIPEYRVMGYVPADKFRDHLDYILTKHPIN
ncbi:protein-disulfide reductase DsbD [Wohlfahrtiimonas larvae]|uniref:Protein-disulfide reductase DsbD n=1 Tax=Wohlfahrtiimonas larvae TaxID=1157986 RepID=A0ABP9MHW6_9GAMM|nr:protein-disulfide reductase DsbD [Wohlfahrtiimonas larvae]